MQGRGGFLEFFLQSLIGQSPILLVYFVSLVVVFMKYGKHPKPAFQAMLALIGLIVVALSATAVQSYMIVQGNFGGGLTALGIASGLARAAFFALLICAVFTDRAKPKPPRRDDYEDDEPDDAPRPARAARRNGD